MKKLILILTVLLTGCYSNKEEEKPKKYNDTIILQNYQGDTLKVYHNVNITFRTDTGVLFRDQNGIGYHLQGGIITLIF